MDRTGTTSIPDASRAWLPPGAIEPFVSRHELARLMGVSVATVDRMVAEGMPSVTWGRRTRRFRPSIAIGWATERGRAV
jgi:phage terminase Nu1 subunit (DNA packaging protein)